MERQEQLCGFPVDARAVPLQQRSTFHDLSCRLPGSTESKLYCSSLNSHFPYFINRGGDLGSLFFCFNCPGLQNRLLTIVAFCVTLCWKYSKTWEWEYFPETSCGLTAVLPFPGGGAFFPPPSLYNLRRCAVHWVGQRS